MLSPEEYRSPFVQTTKYKQYELKINSKKIILWSRLPVNDKLMHQLVICVKLTFLVN